MAGGLIDDASGKYHRREFTETARCRIPPRAHLDVVEGLREFRPGRFAKKRAR